MCDLGAGQSSCLRRARDGGCYTCSEFGQWYHDALNLADRWAEAERLTEHVTVGNDKEGQDEEDEPTKNLICPAEIRIRGVVSLCDALSLIYVAKDDAINDAETDAQHDTRRCQGRSRIRNCRSSRCGVGVASS